MHPRLYSTEDLRERAANTRTFAVQWRHHTAEQRTRTAPGDSNRVTEPAEIYRRRQLAVMERMRAAAGRSAATLLRQLAADTRRRLIEQPGTLTPDEHAQAAAERDMAADYRDWIADQREADADRRDQLANERDRITDERDRQAEERQRRLDEREHLLDLRERLLDRYEGALHQHDQEPDQRDHHAADDPPADG